MAGSEFRHLAEVLGLPLNESPVHPSTELTHTITDPDLAANANVEDEIAVQDSAVRKDPTEKQPPPVNANAPCMRDHYRELGVPFDALESDIETSYHRLMLEHNPNRHLRPGDIDVSEYVEKHYLPRLRAAVFLLAQDLDKAEAAMQVLKHVFAAEVAGSLRYAFRSGVLGDGRHASEPFRSNGEAPTVETGRESEDFWARLRNIECAYFTLSDQVLRAKYDAARRGPAAADEDTMTAHATALPDARDWSGQVFDRSDSGIHNRRDSKSNCESEHHRPATGY